MTHRNHTASSPFAVLHRALFTTVAGLAAFACSPQDVLVHSIQAMNSQETETVINVSDSEGSGGAVGNPTGNPSGDFVKAVDPKEQAFSVAVPKGWKTNLGMERPGGQPRSWVETVSPDGATRVFAGDTRLPYFVEPTSDIAQVTSQANNPLLRVAQYTAPAQFGAQYVQQSFAKAPGFAIRATGPNPQLQKLASERAAKAGIQAQIDAATIEFQYDHEGSRAMGKLFVATFRTQGMWGAEVSGFTTTKNPATANRALETMVASYQTNPAWLKREQQRNQVAMQQSAANHQARMAANQAQFNAHQQKMKGLYAAADQRNQAWMNNFRDDSSHQQFMNGLRSTDPSHDQFVDYIRDEQTITNGELNTKVDAGYDRYWVNETDNTWIGTNGPDDLQVDGYQEWNDQY